MFSFFWGADLLREPLYWRGAAARWSWWTPSKYWDLAQVYLQPACMTRTEVLPLITCGYKAACDRSLQVGSGKQSQGFFPKYLKVACELWVVLKETSLVCQALQFVGLGASHAAGAVQPHVHVLFSSLSANGGPCTAPAAFEEAPTGFWVPFASRIFKVLTSTKQNL